MYRAKMNTIAQRDVIVLIHQAHHVLNPRVMLVVRNMTAVLNHGNQNVLKNHAQDLIVVNLTSATINDAIATRSANIQDIANTTETRHLAVLHHPRRAVLHHLQAAHRHHLAHVHRPHQVHVHHPRHPAGVHQVHHPAVHHQAHPTAHHPVHRVAQVLVN
jgi:hypothetical protein